MSGTEVLSARFEHMADKAAPPNDNRPLTRAELEASNRELKASLARCEELVSDCKDKLVVAHGLTLPNA